MLIFNSTSSIEHHLNYHSSFSSWCSKWWQIFLHQFQLLWRYAHWACSSSSNYFTQPLNTSPPFTVYLIFLAGKFNFTCPNFKVIIFQKCSIWIIMFYFFGIFKKLCISFEIFIWNHFKIICNIYSSTRMTACYWEYSKFNVQNVNISNHY